ncbi:MAG: flagellar hook-length control protein FliK [Rhodocyclaceae bacterium]|nr:flagellar hook-length control protein FliK [Rhodocyclaceae bacterium]
MLEQVNIAGGLAQGSVKAGAKAALADNPLGVFASLLDSASDGETTVSSTATASVGVSTATVGETPVTSGTANDQPQVDPKAVLKDFIDALRSLQASLDAGEDPDPDVLAKLEKDAGQLQDLLTPHDEKHEVVKTIGAVAGLAASILAPALSPVVSAASTAANLLTAGPEPVDAPPTLTGLQTKLAELGSKLNGDDAALADKLSALSDRLADKLPPDALAKLGFPADGTTPDPDLEAAIKSLVSGEKSATPQSQAQGQVQAPAQAATAPPPPDPKALAAAQPTLATPQLKAPETDAVKPAEAAVPATPAADAADSQPAPKDTKLQVKADAPAQQQHAQDAKANVQPPPAADAPPTRTADATTPPPQQAVPGPSAQSAAPRALPAAYQTPQVNVPQLAFEIARQVQHGTSHFQIRLDPPELGRIDVRMHVDGGGNLNARLTVERSETLDLLQRDHRGLERALQQAGVDSGKTNLEFSLKQNPFERQQQGGGYTPPSLPRPTVAAAEPATPPVVTIYRGTASPGGLNLFV